MTDIQNLLVLSKNGAFVRIGVSKKQFLLLWFPNSNDAFEFLRKKLLKGCGMMGQVRRGSRRYFPLQVGVKIFSPNPCSMPIPQNPFSGKD